MGCNLFRHAYNHFDTHEAQHHDTIFNHRIDILLYPYASPIPTLCLCHVCARTCMPMCVWIHLCMRIYARVSSSLLEYVKIYHRSRTFNKYSSLAIYDELLVRLTNQGCQRYFHNTLLKQH